MQISEEEDQFIIIRYKGNRSPEIVQSSNRFTHGRCESNDNRCDVEFHRQMAPVAQRGDAHGVRGCLHVARDECVQRSGVKRLLRVANSVWKNRWPGRGVSATTVSNGSRRIHLLARRGLHLGRGLRRSRNFTEAGADRDDDLAIGTDVCRLSANAGFTGAVLRISRARERSVVPFVTMLEHASVHRRRFDDRDERTRRTNVQQHPRATHRIRVCNPD